MSQESPRLQLPLERCCLSIGRYIHILQHLRCEFSEATEAIELIYEPCFGKVIKLRGGVIRRSSRHDLGAFEWIEQRAAM